MKSLINLGTRASGLKKFRMVLMTVLVCFCATTVTNAQSLIGVTGKVTSNGEPVIGV